MDVFEAIKRRKSVRRYQDKPIPEEVFNRVMEAARLAPSASNRQEWRFIAVRDKSTRRELADMAGGQHFVAEASVVLVCCGIDDGKIMHCGQRACPVDVTIAIDHITLAATAEGLGTCWVGHFDEEPVKRLLGIPDGVRVIELLPIGYPVEDSIKEKNRLPLSEILMIEKWGQRP